ncbi:MAG: extracellular solute-binding protein [Clostridia bacterium]
MKKLLAAVLCLCLMLPLAALAADEPIELNFWIRTSDAFLEEYVGQYMQEHPNVKVNVSQVGSGYGELRTKFNLGITSGELPDLSIAGFSGMGVLYDADAIVDVSKADQAGALSDIVETFASRCRYKDAVIAVPYQVSCPVMYYNKTLLEKLGATVPQTFTELMATAQKAVEKDASGTTKVYGFNTAADINWYVCAMIYNFGGSFFDENGNIKIDTDTTKALYTWWADMVQKGIMPANQHETAQDDFSNGTLLCYFDSCAAYAQIQKNTGDKFDVGVAFFPGEESQSVNLGGNGIVVFTHDEKKQKAALELISYLLAPERMEVIVDKGFLPVTNAMLNSEYTAGKIAADENMRFIYDQVQNISIFIQHPAYAKTTGELTAIASEIEADSSADIMALLEESQAVIDEFMSSYQ